MSSPKLRVLCCSMSPAGHTNPMIGLATALAQRGHEVIFATEKAWTGKLEKLGFKEEPYEERPTTEGVDVSKKWVAFMESMAPGFREERYEAIKRDVQGFSELASAAMYSDSRIKEIIDNNKPHVIVYEQLIWHPSVVTCGIPVAQTVAGHPLIALFGENLPPLKYGLSIHSDPSEWVKYRKRSEEVYGSALKVYNDVLKSRGATTITGGRFRFLSKSLNILIYPRLLVNEYLSRLSPEVAKVCTSISCSLRPTDVTFEIPDKLKSLPGRLVYLSMGSLGSSDVDLMKILVQALAKAGPKYKFIVSKGMLHDKYELTENMWGEAYLSQLGILPLVDLAIIHGGNNTFVETLYFGKPMIVIPLFADQFDNAQQALDAKIGARFNPFTEPGEKLVTLIDEVLRDSQILENVRKISNDMHLNNGLEDALNQIEKVATNKVSVGVL